MAVKDGKRELIDTGTDKHFVKRDKEGRFNESVDVGSSLTTEQCTYSRRSFVSRLGLFCCALPVTAFAQQVRPQSG